MRPEELGITARFATSLSGLSGTAVWLVSDDGDRWRVRKMARASGDSARLETQLAKQTDLAGRDSAPVAVPKVLDSGVHEGRFWFEMDFVRGTDGPTFLRRATVAEVHDFVAVLRRYVEWAASTTPSLPIPETGLFDGLFQRLCRVQSSTSLVPAETFGQLTMALSRLRALDVGTTWCHGDLTLENLQVGPDGQLWVFDLLDAPHEHVWQDVAKLHQDLVGGWYRRAHDPISPATLDFVGRAVLDAATTIDPRYAELHHLLVAMCFVRILPYADDQLVRERAQRALVYFAELASKE